MSVSGQIEILFLWSIWSSFNYFFIANIRSVRLFYVWVFGISALRGVNQLRKALQANFYFNELYNFCALTIFFYSYCTLFKNIDKGSLEFFGPSGVSLLYAKLTCFTISLFHQRFERQLFGVYVVVLVYTYLFEFMLL